MKIKITLLVLFTVLCSMSANADTFTDGIRKRVADGQIEIKMDDSPILDDIFDRTYEQRKEGIIEFVASFFRQHMTEKEFNKWMTYQPSQEEIDYENRLQAMQDEVMKDRHVNWTTDSIKALLAAGKDVEIVKAKPCSKKFKKAYDRFEAANWISMIYGMQKENICSKDKDPLTLKACDIWENNMKNSILNSYIDRSTEKQLKEFSRELKFDKVIKEIGVDYMSNLMEVFEATFGVRIDQVEEIIEKKKDYLISKYGDQRVDFTAGAMGVKRVYIK